MIKYNFSQLVINWAHKHSRKHLPWQINKTLYTVWISEIMLQQTSVKTVIPYFNKFILKFPNINSLINGTLNEILHLWSGLGYYRRAKNIYKTSKIIEKEYQKKFPDCFHNIIKLPGIGQSTAGAILSLSKNYFFPILDGNVKRILIRYYGIIGYLQDSKIEKKLWILTKSITPIHNAGIFNQAMMDIGALICIPGRPKCNLCPLIQRCIATKTEEWTKYPLKKIKKTLITKKSWFILIQYKTKIWMIKNIKKEIWKNLFLFPNFDNKKTALEWLKNKKININNLHNTTSFLHKFSHFILHIYPILIVLSSRPKISENENGIWYNLKKPQNIGIPKAIEKILKIFNIKKIGQNNK